MSGPIALFFGTRPQVIKASVLRRALASAGDVLAVDTGQHYDYALQQVHYDQLGVRPADAYLNIGSGSHASQTAAILTACEAWMLEHRPRLAVVIGDTNSTVACALAAAKLRVPVAHVEAGLRAKDRAMAEEINRRVVDAIADVLFAPSPRAAATLRHERPEAAIEVSGDVAYDVLLGALSRVPSPDAVAGYQREWVDGFVYVTLHRAELVDAPERLNRVLAALSRSPLPCLLAAHPRTQQAISSTGLQVRDALSMGGPLGYLESLALARTAKAVVTDSGGLQREAYWLGVPCFTVRDETEWAETIECGANHLVPPDVAAALPEMIATLNGTAPRWDRTAYGDGHAAHCPQQPIALGAVVGGLRQVDQEQQLVFHLEEPCRLLR